MTETDRASERAGPLDVRTRLVALMAFAVATVSLQAWWALGLALAVAMLGALALGTAPRRLRHALGHLEAPLLCLLVTVPVSVAGTPVLDLGPLQVSDAGLALAGRLVLKIATVTLAVAGLLGGLAPTALAGGLAALRLPPTLVQLLFLSERYVGLLRREFESLRMAMKARAFQPRTDWHTLRSYGTLVGMLLVRALERAERVRDAMRCRGYSGSFVAFAARAGQWPLGERLALAAGCLLLAALVTADRVGLVPV